VVDETHTGMGRLGRVWGMERLELDRPPDAVVQGAAAQLGGVWVSDRYYVDAPLQLISTWDGDEVSLIRAGLLWDALASERTWERAVTMGDYLKVRLRDAGLLRVRGAGLMVAGDLPDGATRDRVRRAALMAGVLVDADGERGIRLTPPLNLRRAEACEAMDALARALAGRQG
jgi:L-lysine 6-transaminase